MASHDPASRRGLISTLLNSLWPPSNTREAKPRYSEEVIRKLWWLTDVPTFMDDRLVDRLYSAIIRPESILLQSSETAERSRSSTFTSEMEAGGSVSIPAFWNLSGKARAADEASTASSHGTQITRQFVHPSERRLQDIISHYGEKHPDRLLIDQAGQSTLSNLSGETLDWSEAVGLLDIPGPRPLLFIEMDRFVPIMPMAGGTEAGATVLLSAQVISELQKQSRAIPVWPADNDEQAPQKKAEHWNALMRCVARCGVCRSPGGPDTLFTGEPRRSRVVSSPP